MEVSSYLSSEEQDMGTIFIRGEGSEENCVAKKIPCMSNSAKPERNAGAI